MHGGFYSLEDEVAMQVETGKGKYKIKFKDGFEGLLSSIKELNNSYSKLVIISDENVASIYKEEVMKVLSGAGLETFFIAFFAGEKSKNLANISSIYENLIDYKIDRDSLIIALGGGVVGDIAGFVAATYMRGIDYVQVPTTLLAQVDSSIGGKTGFNHSSKKNIVGAFYPPILVYSNINSLKTLDNRQFANGMAELIKHAIICDRDYLDFLYDNSEEIKDMDFELLSKAIKRSCEIKSEVVSKDEKEKGIRKILNFGHSVGHAIESLLNYDLLHGECVSLGMAFAAKLSLDLGGISKQEYEKIIEILLAYNLPVKIKIDAKAIYQELFYDKKSSFGKIGIICLDGIAEPYFKDDCSKVEILGALASIIDGD